MPIPLDAERPNLLGYVFLGSAMPLQGAFTSFGDSLLFMHTPFDAELPNLMW